MTGVQIPAPIVQDTIAAVFSDRAYGRPSLLRRFLGWLLRKLGEWFDALNPGRMSPALFWTLFAILVLLVTAVLARWSWLLIASRRPGSRAAALREARRLDPWMRVRELASAGDYTGAAHALYAALLASFAGAGEVQLDRSKTVGDYTRELAARSSSRLPRFREFARGYETVIYGIGYCDRERFERLRSIAQHLEPHG